MTWMCPKCRGNNLRVEIQMTTMARLIQEGDGNFQTDDDKGGDHEWGGESQMDCCDCGHTGKAASFRVPDDYPALLEMAQRMARMKYDGEEGKGEDGDDYDMSGDDAAETLSLLIREAREIVGED